ncbi:MAG: hypothetical protein L6461_16430 [Anaerolineae bacterium]|nr:hypothetical protein [Anaerolineae bacterium]
MSIQTEELNHTTWHSVVILLARAFFSGVLSMTGIFVGIWAYFLYSIGKARGELIGWGGFLLLLVALLVIFLFAASFFVFRIRLEKSPLRKLAILPAVIIWGVGFVWYFSSKQSMDFFWEVLLWVSLVSFLLASRQLKLWSDWVGLFLALLVGMGIHQLETLYKDGVILLPEWIFSLHALKSPFFLIGLLTKSKIA